jgi:hypothetical protein
MKKIILLSLSLISVSKSAVIQLSTSASSSALSNLGNSSGNASLAAVWGIIVDRSGNGFQASSYDPGFTITATTSISGPQSVDTTGDDVVYISSGLTSLTQNYDGALGVSTPRTINNINYLAPSSGGAAVSGGMSFAVIWFDYGTISDQIVTANTKFGLIQNSSLVLPSSSASTQDYSALFIGVDALRTMNFTVVPEASTTLLSSLGLFAMLRRRR